MVLRQRLAQYFSKISIPLLFYKMFKCCRKPEYTDDDLPQDQPKQPESRFDPPTQHDEE